jgi:hypothetical protein
MQGKPVLLHYRFLLYALFNNFFRFGGGRPLNKVQFLTFRNRLEIQMVLFTPSDMRACPRASCSVFMLSGISCLKSQLLILPSPPGCTWHHFWSACLFWDLSATLSLLRPWQLCLLCRATSVRRVILRHFSWVMFVLKLSLLRHANVAWWDTFLSVSFFVCLATLAWRLVPLWATATSGFLSSEVGSSSGHASIVW